MNHRLNPRFSALLLLLICARSTAVAGSPEPPLRVASITPAAPQPARGDAAVIFYDDFAVAPETGTSRYLEYNSPEGSFVWSPDGGLGGGAMRCQFAKGQVAAGGLKVLFGRNPLGRGIRREETFNEIYWRVYVKHEHSDVYGPTAHFIPAWGKAPCQGLYKAASANGGIYSSQRPPTLDPGRRGGSVVDTSDDWRFRPERRKRRMRTRGLPAEAGHKARRWRSGICG